LTSFTCFARRSVMSAFSAASVRSRKIAARIWAVDSSTERRFAGTVPRRHTIANAAPSATG
jgi:hypothetical protein